MEELQQNARGSTKTALLSTQRTNQQRRKEIEQQASCAVGSRQRKQDKRSDIEREHKEREKKEAPKTGGYDS